MSGSTPNLRIRFALTFGLLTLLLSLLLGIAVGGDATERIRNAVGASLERMAVHVADRLRQELTRRQGELQLAAAAGADPTALRERLEQLRTHFPHYAWLGYVAADGTITVAADGLLEGGNVTDQAWFTEGLKGPHIGRVAASLQLERARPAATGPDHYLALAVPTHAADGSVNGVLGAQLNWRWARQLAQEVAAAGPPAPATDIMLVDEQGLVQLGPPELEGQPLPFPRALQRQRYLIETWPDGQRYISALDTGSSNQPPSGWRVLVRQEADSALAPVVRLQRHIVGWGVFASVLFAAIGWWSGERVAAPLRKLTAAIRQARHDQRFDALSERHDYREIEALSAEIATLATQLSDERDQLRALTGSLREAVEERAMELRNASLRTEQEIAERRRLQEERERLIARMQELADIDPITEVANRRYFERLAEAELERARERAQALALLAFDIDQLAELNEAHGPALVEEILRGVAQCARAGLRQVDTLARIGSEGFVALLPETDLATAMSVAERLRTAIAAQTFDHRGQPLKVTVSIGVADLQAHNRHIDELLKRANAALYQARQGGGDQARQA